MEVIILKEVEEFIRNLERQDRTRAEVHLEILENLGSDIRMPHSKNILPGIFELRVGGKQNIRLIFTFYEGHPVVFHGFKKKTQQIENREINLIKAKFKDLHI